MTASAVTSRSAALHPPGRVSRLESSRYPAFGPSCRNRGLAKTRSRAPHPSESARPSALSPFRFLIARRKRTPSIHLGMVRFTLIVLAALLCLTKSRAEKVALTGATVINPADGKTIAHAVLLTDGDRIAAVGSPEDVKLPPQVRRIDCNGKFILPGLHRYACSLLPIRRCLHSTRRSRSNQRPPLQGRGRVDQIASR